MVGGYDSVTGHAGKDFTLTMVSAWQRGHTVRACAESPFACLPVCIVTSVCARVCVCVYVNVLCSWP